MKRLSWIFGFIFIVIVRSTNGQVIERDNTKTNTTKTFWNCSDINNSTFNGRYTGTHLNDVKYYNRNLMLSVVDNLKAEFGVELDVNFNNSSIPPIINSFYSNIQGNLNFVGIIGDDLNANSYSFKFWDEQTLPQDIQPAIEIYYAVVLPTNEGVKSVSVALDVLTHKTRPGVNKAKALPSDVEQLLLSNVWSYSNSDYETLVQNGGRFNYDGSFAYIPWTKLLIPHNANQDYPKEYRFTINGIQGGNTDATKAILFFSAFCSTKPITQPQTLLQCPGINTLEIDISDCNNYSDVYTGSAIQILDSEVDEVNQKLELTYIFTSSLSPNDALIRTQCGEYIVELDQDCFNQSSFCGNLKFHEGDEYVINFWGKNEVLQNDRISGQGQVIIEFQGNGKFASEVIPLNPEKAGDWHQVEHTFRVPDGATTGTLKFFNQGLANSYFDDVRLIPQSANALGYIYDPSTRQLLAILDENNYATIYQYDHEGNLVRVKKETDRDVYTISEGRKELVKDVNH